MRPQLRLNVAAIGLYLALGTMFATTPLFVTEELGGSKALAGLSVSIFFIAAVITRPIVGRLTDRHGRRPFLVVPPFAIAAALVAMLGAHWIPAVLAIRFVLGVFGSTFYTAAVTTSTDLAPGKQASAVATLSISIYLGFAAGPPIGESLLHTALPLAWLVPAVLAVAAGVVIVGITETLPQPAPEPGLEPDREPATDIEEVYADAAPGLTGGGPVEPTGAAGPTHLLLGLLHPAAVLPGLTLLTLGIGYQAVTSQSALYATTIGLATSAPLYNAFALSILVIRLVSGRLADRIGPEKVMFPGVACVAVGFVTVSLWPTPLPAVLGIALVGAGWALVFPAVTAWLSTHVPDAERGTALGSLIAFMDIGQGSGGYLVGAVADADGFATAFLVPAVAAVVGGLVLVVAIRRAPTTTTAPDGAGGGTNPAPRAGS